MFAIPGFCLTHVDAIETDLREGGEVDVVPALCRPLPAHVIAHMIGVTDEMVPVVIEWADLMANATASGFLIDYAKDPHWLASELPNGSAIAPKSTSMAGCGAAPM